MAVPRLRGGDVLYALFHNARLDFLWQVVDILAAAGEELARKARLAGREDMATTIEDAIARLKEKVRAIPYVKDGDYVLAEHHNLIVDALDYAREVAEALYYYAKEIEAARLPEKVRAGPHDAPYETLAKARLAEIVTDYMEAVDSDWSLATAGTSGTAMATKVTGHYSSLGGLPTEVLVDHHNLSYVVMWLTPWVVKEYTETLRVYEIVYPVVVDPKLTESERVEATLLSTGTTTVHVEARRSGQALARALALALARVDVVRHRPQELVVLGSRPETVAERRAEHKVVGYAAPWTRKGTPVLSATVLVDYSLATAGTSGTALVEKRAEDYRIGSMHTGQASAADRLAMHKPTVSLNPPFATVRADLHRSDVSPLGAQLAERTITVRRVEFVW